MYSIIDFKKYGPLTLDSSGKVVVTDVPNYDVDKLDNPNVPILVTNLKLVSPQGVSTVYSGFLHCRANTNAGVNSWDMSIVAMSKTTPTSITVRIPTKA